MRKLLLLLLSNIAFGQAFMPVTSTSIYNGSSGLLPSGTIIFQATDSNGNSISYQAGGGGSQITGPTICTVTNGVIGQPCQVADTTLTNPANICFSTTIKNSANQIVLGGSQSSGYQCVQPASTGPASYWCPSGSCNFDIYVPNILGVAIARLPFPTPYTLGGIFAGDCITGQVVQGYSAGGRPDCVAGGTGGSAAWGGITGDITNQTDLSTALTLRAPILNPSLTGTPNAPTQLLTDSSTAIATDAFVKGQAYAPLASPNLTGTPTSPTPPTVDSSSKIANTAWVNAQGYGTNAGNVSGPSVSTNNGIPVFVGVNGRTLGDSGITFPIPRASLGTLVAGSNGLANSATIDTTNAGNITTGTLAAARIPTLNQSTTGTAVGLSGTQTAKFFYAAPNGASGVGLWRAVLASDIPTLNQSTTGLAGTATALAATPSQCPGGQFATGVTVSGGANCGTPAGGGNVSYSGTITSGQIALWASSTTIQSVAMSGDGTFSSGGVLIIKGLNGTILSSLATGILKNTTTSGVPSIAVAADFPTLNQSTTGTASNLSGTPALPSGTTATTQTTGDNTTKLATDAFVLANAGGSTLTVNGGSVITTPNIISGTGITAVQSSNNVIHNLNAASAGAIGGVNSITSAAHNWITYIDTSGLPHQAQPTCGDLSNSVSSCSVDATVATNISSGTLPAARLPVPSTTTLGGIESIPSLTHTWIYSISNSGVPLQSQPAAADVSGLAASATTDTTVATNITSGTLAAARVATLNQNTTGTAANLSGTPALPNGVTGTTQTGGDNSTLLATDAFVLANAGSGPVLGTSAQFPVMNSGATAYIPQTISGDTTVTTAGVATVASLHLSTPTTGALTSETSGGNITASNFTDVSNTGNYGGSNGFQANSLTSSGPGGGLIGGSQGLAQQPITNGFGWQQPENVSSGFSTVVPNAPAAGIWQTTIVATGPSATGVLTSGVVTSTTSYSQGTASSSLGYANAPPCSASGGSPTTPAQCHFVMTGTYPNEIPAATGGIVIDFGGTGYGSAPTFSAGSEQNLQILPSLPVGTANIPIVASLTTTAATSNTVTVTGMTSSGHCQFSPTNALAATNYSTSYVSAKTTNQITITHVATSGLTYDILCTSN